MNSVTISVFVLAVICVLVILMWLYSMVVQARLYQSQLDRLMTEHRKDLEDWNRERQQLLDRIQAPSFDHLKHHEVKVIKALNNEREPPPLDPL